jgi:hypothetical protein
LSRRRSDSRTICSHPEEQGDDDQLNENLIILTKLLKDLEWYEVMSNGFSMTIEIHVTKAFETQYREASNDLLEDKGRYQAILTEHFDNFVEDNNIKVRYTSIEQLWSQDHLKQLRFMYRRK